MKDSIEESIIDHVMITEDLANSLISLKIDEERNNVLTSIAKTKKGVKKSMSDHNPLTAHFEIEWCRKTKKNRVEMFNLKNKLCQEKFKALTSQLGHLHLMEKMI